MNSPSHQNPERNAADRLSDGWQRSAVLVVDDEEGMRNFLGKTLRARCGQVMAAASAEEADQLARAHRFDLVILDITLPGKSGITWLRELREQGYSRRGGADHRVRRPRNRDRGAARRRVATSS